MHKSLATVAGAAAFLLVACRPAGAQQAPCVGDCDNTGTVTINEIITCVNIGLDLLQLSSCNKCDTDGDGQVSISEIITGVNQGLDLLQLPPARRMRRRHRRPGRGLRRRQQFRRRRLRQELHQRDETLR